MRAYTFTHEVSDGAVRCLYVDFGKRRLLIAYASENWYDEDKPRKIPLWVTKGEVFAGRLAIRFGRRKDVTK